MGSRRAAGRASWGCGSTTCGARSRGSLLESGAGLHDVRDFLGHTDITTTSKHLAATPVRLRAALDRMEGTPDAPPDRHAEPPADLPGQTSVLVN